MKPNDIYITQSKHHFCVDDFSDPKNKDEPGYSHSQYEDCIRENSSMFYLVLGAQPIGFISIMHYAEVYDDEIASMFELKFIFLKEAYRNQGFSKHLLDAGFEYITTSTLQIAAHTDHLVRLLVARSIYSQEGEIAARHIAHRIEKWVAIEAPSNITLSSPLAKPLV